VRLGGRCHGHKLDTDNTAGKAKNARFDLIEAESHQSGKIFCPKRANVQQSGKEGVFDPAMHDWLSTEGSEKGNTHTAGNGS